MIVKRNLQHQNNQEDGPNIWIIKQLYPYETGFSNDQIHGNANLYKLRMGTDLYNEVSNKGEQQLFGIMAAYGNGSQTTSASFANRDSKGSVDGFLLGVYGSWFENAHDRSGWYADTWFQYGWFDNEVNGAGLSKESYDTNGWGLSAEIGKSINYKSFSLPIPSLIMIRILKIMAVLSLLAMKPIFKHVWDCVG